MIREDKMSTEQSIWRETFEAAEDLSDYQYHFVVLNTSGKVRLLDAEDEVAIGILQNAPESGEAAEVMILGKSKCVANAALAIGTFVKPEYVGAADAGKADDAGTWWDAARGMVVESAGAEDDLCSVWLFTPFARTKGGMVKQMTVTDEIGTETLTTAEVLGGFIDGTPTGAATYTLPTGTLMGGALNQVGIGNAIEFTVKNSSAGAHVITIAAGTDGTTKGTMTIAQNNTKRFLLIMTSATEYDLYSLGTVEH
ncbi:MAG: hypothetical protein AVO38_16315 [delta proteobacterium ML8_D]|nr:MAG: hypothetical protein AVO38_16315 [delta proteobacterium ML8_D]